MRIPVHRSVLIYTGCSPCRPCPCFLVPHVMFAARCPTWSLRSLNTKKTSHHVYLCVCCPVVPNQEIPQDPSRPIKTHQDPSRPHLLDSKYFPNVVPMIRTRRNVFAGIGMLAIVVEPRPSKRCWISTSIHCNQGSLKKRMRGSGLWKRRSNSVYPPQTSVPDHPSRNKRLSNVADCRSFISF